MEADYAAVVLLEACVLRGRWRVARVEAQVLPGAASVLFFRPDGPGWREVARIPLPETADDKGALASSSLRSSEVFVDVAAAVVLGPGDCVGVDGAVPFSQNFDEAKTACAPGGECFPRAYSVRARLISAS